MIIFRWSFWVQSSTVLKDSTHHSLPNPLAYEWNSHIWEGSGIYLYYLVVSRGDILFFEIPLKNKEIDLSLTQDSNLTPRVKLSFNQTADSLKYFMPQLINVYTYVSEFTQITISLLLLILTYSAVVLPASTGSDSTVLSLLG